MHTSCYWDLRLTLCYIPPCYFFIFLSLISFPLLFLFSVYIVVLSIFKIIFPYLFKSRLYNFLVCPLLFFCCSFFFPLFVLHCPSSIYFIFLFFCVLSLSFLLCSFFLFSSVYFIFLFFCLLYLSFLLCSFSFFSSVFFLLFFFMRKEYFSKMKKLLPEKRNDCES